jgi:hypothetical protein
MKAAARQEAEGDRAVRNKVRGELRQVMALYLTEQGSRCVGG